MCRKILTADTRLNIRPDGNDQSGDGVTVPFATPHGAYEWALHNLDASGYFVKFKMAPGVYGSAPHRRHTTEYNSEKTVLTINANIPNAAYVIFEGNRGNPDSVVWDANGSMCIWGAAGGGKWAFQGVKLLNSGATANVKGLFCNAAGANYDFNDADFGHGFGGAHIQLYGPNVVKIFGDYTISGGANNHIWLEGGASADLETHTCTLINNPHFRDSFLEVENNSHAVIIGVTYSGAATGVRYRQKGGGFIACNNNLNTLLPGDRPGVTT